MRTKRFLILTATGLAISAMVLSGCGAQNEGQNAEPTPSVVYPQDSIYANRDAITPADAKSIALEDANVTAPKNLTVNPDVEKSGIAVFEVTFMSDDMTYEYEIEMETGRILDRDRAKIGHSVEEEPDKEPMKREEALQIALNDAIVKERDVWDPEVELELENGIRVYSIDFSCDGYEYKYEIHSVTGEILKREIAVDD